MSTARFRETALYNDYYRWLGIDCVVALPMFVDDRWLVSFAQLGAILGISRRTVQKHLQHLDKSLGAESRTAAAMRVAAPRRHSAAAAR